MLHPLKAIGLILLLATPAYAVESELGALPENEPSAADASDSKASAKADRTEKFPIGASLSLSHSFAHSEFVEDTDGIDSAGQFLSLGLNLSYGVTDAISTNASISVLKVVDTGFLSGSSGSGLVNYETVLSDLSLGAGWSFYTIPVAEIRLSANGGVRLPTSKGSITRGLIIAPRIGLSASKKLGPVNLSVNGGYNHNVWENATQRIEPRFVDLIQISGADLGLALPLSGWNVGASASVKVVDGLTASVSYTLSNRVSAVYGKDDEFTPAIDGVQTGVQVGTGAHAFVASLGYTLPFETGTSIALSMSTSQGLYSADGQRVTNPFFDTESAQGIGTGYSIGIAQSL